MENLIPEDVAALANALGLTIDEEDLNDVTHRLNALMYDMSKLSLDDLDEILPVSASLWNEESHG